MARLRFNLLATNSGPLALGAALTTTGTAVTFNAALTHSTGTAVPTLASNDYIPLTIGTEIVWLTAYTSGGTTGTILRAQENTSGVSHASGDKVIHGPTVSDFGRDYRWFVPAGVASIDEFNDDTLNAAWTRVDGTGAPVGNVTWAEGGDSLAMSNIGGDTAAIHALLRPIGTSMVVGDAFITALTNFGAPGTNYSITGLILADGTTHGSGKQVTARSIVDAAVPQKADVVNYTGFTTVSSATATGLSTPPGAVVYLRLVMTAANTWRADVSPNGVRWRIGEAIAYTITPTHVGFWATSSSTSTKFEAAFEFLRRASGVS